MRQQNVKEMCICDSCNIDRVKQTNGMCGSTTDKELDQRAEIEIKPKHRVSA